MPRTLYFFSSLAIACRFALVGFLVGVANVLLFLTPGTVGFLPWEIVVSGILGAIVGLVGAAAVALTGLCVKNPRVFMVVSCATGAFAVGTTSHYFLGQLHVVYQIQIAALYVACFVIGVAIFHKRIRDYLHYSGI